MILANGAHSAWSFLICSATVRACACGGKSGLICADDLRRGDAGSSRRRRSRSAGPFIPNSFCAVGRSKTAMVAPPSELIEPHWSSPTTRKRSSGPDALDADRVADADVRLLRAGDVDRDLAGAAGPAPVDDLERDPSAPKSRGHGRSRARAGRPGRPGCPCASISARRLGLDGAVGAIGAGERFDCARAARRERCGRSLVEPPLTSDLAETTAEVPARAEAISVLNDLLIVSVST